MQGCILRKALPHSTHVLCHSFTRFVALFIALFRVCAIAIIGCVFVNITVGGSDYASSRTVRTRRTMRSPQQLKHV